MERMIASITFTVVVVVLVVVPLVVVELPLVVGAFEVLEWELRTSGLVET
jgi:hypothetical protein